MNIQKELNPAQRVAMLQRLQHRQLPKHLHAAYKRGHSDGYLHGTERHSYSLSAHRSIYCEGYEAGVSDFSETIDQGEI